MKKLILSFIMSVVAIYAFADIYSLSKEEKYKINEEAENWIDNMPDGLQDKLSDAISHAQQGVLSEINYFRNIADTNGIGLYKVEVRDISANNNACLPVRLYSSNNTQKKEKPLLIYFHGGGWSLGSINTTEKFCRALASEGNVNIISVEYPLAPENPFPAAINKCLETVKYIISNSGEWNFLWNKVSLGGDGAGGNIALEVYNKLPEDMLIESLVLFYPLIKTYGELNKDDKRSYGRGYGFDSRLWEEFIEAYNNSSEMNYKELPSTLLISSGRDIIIEDSRKLAANFTNIEYIELEDALHGFITDGNQTTAFNKAVELTDIFLTK